MKKLTPNDLFPNFEVTTLENGLQTISSLVQKEKAVIWFLRYYGCPVCQLDLQQIKESYAQFSDKNCDVIVVLQSNAQAMAAQMEKGYYPYTIICDKDCALYENLDVSVAKSTLAMVNLKAIQKVSAAKKQGYVHGAYEGKEQQLPAVFVVDKELNVQFSHYAKKLADMPSVAEMLNKI